MSVGSNVRPTASVTVADVQDQDLVLSARGLRKSYGGKHGASVHAVNQADLDVRQGELVVLLGPSGCGKTTLLRMLAGLERPDTGSIELHGSVVFDAAARTWVGPERRRVGMMFQSYALWPHMSVAKNAAYPLEGRRGDARPSRDEIGRRVHDMLSRLGLDGLGGRYPGELSGGQQQRVALARALLGEPAVVFFDEPLSNVDTKVRRRLRGMIRELKQEGLISGVYVTHDQEEAIELGDRVAVMQHGRIVQIDTPLEIYEHPKSMYVAEVIGEANAIPAEITQRQGQALVAKTPLGTFRCVAEQDAKPGDEGELVVRPEQVQVRALEDAPASGPRAGRLTHGGTVTEVIPLGSAVELHVACGGVSLMAITSGDDRAAAAVLQSGASVSVELPGEGLPWVPREGTR
jgi:iron(III) transport system ATP-binding protein